MEYDYIIIGAGSAGNVLAARLTEDADVSVLLLEAGGPDYRLDFRTQMPAALAYPLQGTRYNWAYQTDPEPHMNNRRMDCGRGKGLGGSSLINGMCYIRAFVAPTIFSDCSDEMSIVREEIFGPVLSLLEYQDEDEVIRRANDTEYGLAAGVVTSDLARAHRIIHRLEAGICWINTWGESPAQMPVGGYKQSGIGRENGIASLAHYTRVKSVQVELGEFASVF